MDLTPFIIRETVISAVRAFFSAKGFHEALVPVLSSGLPLEPTLYPFRTVWQTTGGERNLYLAVSPEAALKKLLAAGLGNCFAFGKSFRNIEDASPTHMPEFTMLEWYRPDASYLTIMDETEDLIRHVAAVVAVVRKRPDTGSIGWQGTDIPLEGPWPRLGMPELFREHTGIVLSEVMDDAAMAAAASARGYTTRGATWEQCFNQIFLNEIEPHLPQGPVFLTDFPSRISPLCAVRADRPDYAERFELYLGGMEIGNGNTEKTDAADIRGLFDRERAERTRTGKPAAPVDGGFLDALDILSGRRIAGIGIGVDRLAMLCADVTQITDVEPLFGL